MKNTSLAFALWRGLLIWIISSAVFYVLIESWDFLLFH